MADFDNLVDDTGSSDSDQDQGIEVQSEIEDEEPQPLNKQAVLEFLQMERLRMRAIINQGWYREQHDDFERAEKLYTEETTATSQKCLKTMLEDEIETDCVLIGCDGEEFKCHKAVLAAQVMRFRTMFSHKETQESKTGRIKVPDELGMNGKAIKIFLRYVYNLEVVAFAEDFNVSSSLLQAGHYYNITSLIGDVVTIIKFYLQEERKLVINSEWGSIESYWELYQFVRLWDDKHPCKQRVVRILFKMIRRLWIKYDSAGDKMIMELITNKDDAMKEFITKLCINENFQDEWDPPDPSGSICHFHSSRPRSFRGRRMHVRLGMTAREYYRGVDRDYNMHDA